MKIRLVIKEDVGRIEERTLQVNYLIPFKSCYKGFPVIKYTYVPCLKVTMLCVFAFCYLIVLKFFWAITYSEPCQTSKMELFAKIVISKEVTSLLRRFKELWIRLHSFWFILQYILGLKWHVYFAISVRLDFHSKR